MGRPPSSSRTEDAPVETKKHKVTTPWKRARILDAPDKEGFVRRWVTTSRIGNVEKKQDEGWAFVTTAEGKHIARTVEDGTTVDGVVRKRELVLMELPIDRKEARDEWLKSRTPTPAAMAKEFSKDVGGSSYGDIVTEGG